MSAKKDMPATRRVLAEWDRSSNPLLHVAAGRLRQALREDGRNDVTEAARPTTEEARDE